MRGHRWPPHQPPGSTCTVTSTASAEARLGIQTSMGAARVRHSARGGLRAGQVPGMDFVTITDHDTIVGCLEIADRPDVFVSEELTTWFPGEAQAVHVLCFDITEADHECLQAQRRRSGGLRRLPRQAGDRLRPGAPVLRRRSAAGSPSSPPARGAVRDLGGAKRFPRSGPEHPRRRLHRDPRRNRHRWLRRSRRRRHRPHLDGDSGPRRRRKSFFGMFGPEPPAPTATRAARAKWAHAALALAIRSLLGDEPRPGSPRSCGPTRC